MINLSVNLKKVFKTFKHLFLALFLVFICSFTNGNHPKIIMIGDSTMSIKSSKAEPENGWGMGLPAWLKKGVELQNYARNGRSTKSFIDEGLWDTACDHLAKGDFVIIQFGHNDEKNEDPKRYTTPQSTYKENLIKFINQTRAKKAFPILCTPIARRIFDENGRLKNTHGDYLLAVKEVAIAYQVPLVDLEKLTTDTLNHLGNVASKKFFMVLDKNEYPNFPDGKIDNTHLRKEGATLVAKLFVQDAQRQHLTITSLFKPN